jgi:multidrug efflux pump subunit AcrA (membrane-fusion protein)
VSRFQNKLWLWGSIAVLLLAASVWTFVVASHRKNIADPADARREGRPIPVRCELVSLQTTDDMVGATAVTVASQTAMLQVGASQTLTVDGPIAVLVVKNLYAHEGDFIHKGQIICEFDDRGYNEFLQQKKVALDAAKDALEQVQAQVKFNHTVRDLNLKSAQAGIKYRTEDKQNRQKESDIFRKLSSTGAASQIQFFDAQSALLSADFELTEATRTLEQTKDALIVGALADKEALARAGSVVSSAQTDLDLANEEASRFKVRSPFDGYLTFETGAGGTRGASQSGTRVGSVPVVEPAVGQVFAADAIIGQVLALDPIDVLVDWPLERIGDVRVRQTANIVLDSFPKESFVGQVLRIGPQVNSELRVLPVLVRVANPGVRIKPGITGFVRISVHKSVTTVPSSALLYEKGGAMVFCVKDGRAFRREVRTGRTAPDGVEVLDGLAAGDQVVVFQNFYRHSDAMVATDCYLKDNDRVDVQWKKWAERE